MCRGWFEGNKRVYQISLNIVIKTDAGLLILNKLI